MKCRSLLLTHFEESDKQAHELTPVMRDEEERVQ